ncbi:AraC family transcriptional regulator [Sinimarinibacterium sp. CAU 1509]|uniref:AraC family transcriptional regulator n=1 Tax=Sinimarinibacterium sp. CAU 1509 TaxID=2562283 RepID=UPI0010ABB602|nr:AraC family transcriptional regulator [Sinimarinibacterium sp. CAU 1509]TJY55931.1 AraC family transcriptional regulator [Sinimarinibacterium sp. CAU 1509]
MTSRSILGLMYTMQGLQKLGEDPVPVLARHGIDLEALDPNARIDRTQELRLYTEVAEHLRDPAAGLHVGRFMGFAGYGPLTMLLMTCNDTLHAIEEGIRYQALTYLYCTLSYQRGEQDSTLSLAPPPLDPRVLRFRVDTEMSGTFKLINDLQATLGTGIRPDRVDIPYARPDDVGVYEAHYGCTVRFGRDQARFWVRNELLDIRFPTADPVAHAVYRRQCDQQLQSYQSELEGLGQQVGRYLELFNERFPDAAEVARFFGLSERAMRRRLGEEGESFRDLLGGVRYAKARDLLRTTDLNVETIAERLGYSEPAAFIHAFQRWSATTPMAYRNSRGTPER